MAKSTLFLLLGSSELLIIRKPDWVEREISTYLASHARDPKLILVDGAGFNRDESRILTWSADGTARLWDISLDEMSIDERTLDFQVRSATSLSGSVEAKVLTFEQWMAKRHELETMRAKRRFTK